MMFLSNTTPTKQARSTYLFGQKRLWAICHIVVAYVTLGNFLYNLQCYSLQMLLSIRIDVILNVLAAKF